MAEVNTFYVNPAVTISQNAQTNLFEGDDTPTNIQSNVQNQGGETVLNIGSPIDDTAGNTPFIVDPGTGEEVINPMWAPTYSDATYEGDVTDRSGDTVVNSSELVTDVNGVAPGGQNYITTFGPDFFDSTLTQRYPLIDDSMGRSPGDAMYVTTYGSSPIFNGVAKGLNIQNSTNNGPAPLNQLGRLVYNAVTITETEFAALETADTVDDNTLYLIREVV